MINLLGNTPNQPSYGMYSTGSQVKFKTSMIILSLCDYSDTCRLVKGTITVAKRAAEGAARNNRNKKVKFKNYIPFTVCVSETNDDEIDRAKEFHIAVPMYNMIEYIDNCSKTSRSLRQYYRDEPFLNNNGVIIDVLDDPNSASFKYKIKTTNQARNDGTKDI